jgi:hypothetical protein
MTSEELMRANLIALAQRYAEAKGWSLATVSKEIHGNQAFLNAYLAGEMAPRVDTYFSMVEKLRANWPKEALAWAKVDAREWKTKASNGDAFEVRREEGDSYHLFVRGRRRGAPHGSLAEAKAAAAAMAPEIPWPDTAALPKLGKKVDKLIAA